MEFIIGTTSNEKSFLNYYEKLKEEMNYSQNTSAEFLKMKKFTGQNVANLLMKKSAFYDGNTDQWCKRDESSSAGKIGLASGFI